MARFDLKIVPDAEPNADGEWVTEDVPAAFTGRAIFSFVPKPGYHVVQARKVPSLQDGGPMHARGYER